MSEELTTSLVAPAIIEPCDGPTFRNLVKAGLAWLEHNRDIVNALNVFPVPDGDTGTNMLLTMRSAHTRMESTPDVTHVGQLAQSVSRGALMGARGNSGVILSQIWRGFAEAAQAKSALTAADFAAALRQASDTAYRGVMRPVEGTILTVAREMAEEAEAAVDADVNWHALLIRMLARGKTSLAHTPELLPVLKQAGVVDSGGQGLVFILEGMVRWLNGEMDLVLQSTGAAGGAAGDVMTAQALARPEGGQIENPYDVQFILLGHNLDVAQVRARIDAMGDSTVVVGDSSTIKVHIHVKDPGEPLSYGITLGQITDVVVENMQEQMEEIIGASSVNGVVSAESTPVPAPTVQPGQIGVVTVAAGDGLATVFRSLGVSQVVSGGQTNNPSTEEIFQAIQDTPTDKVIILPNNKNIILAAEAARDLSPKHVTVVPTTSVPQAIAALMNLDPDGDLDAVTQSMTDTLDDVSTIEFTTATRTVSLDGVDVAEGQIIALANGKLCASGSSIDDIVEKALDKVHLETFELATIYYGADVSAEQATAFAEKIEDLYPELETEVVAGGQAHYFYILGIE